ncbi:SDR family NAD(P)-dependent oxidoreductase [Massilia cavernae]|uniref:SDR family oxidoreductase n=1 Tax=Massilia cavernae TaxID=2320864 RepID=A0A418Y0L7_9BURK|nr:SDR family oxidoreductase [Massilia cavernae]RJG18838.1 SDR family oxidoreductase [Massilia cavernae]
MNSSDTLALREIKVPSLALHGRRALVTGASSGLGLHFAHVLAHAGAEVLLVARRLDKLESHVAALREAGCAAHAVFMDVTDSASVKAAFDHIEAHHGCPDIIVNNAGVAVSKPALEQDEADWDLVIDTNLKGAWLTATEAVRRLVAAGLPGNVVNVASILGERVGGAVAPYCASKAGLVHLTRAMALEWARHGVRVNALAPGYLQTDLNSDFLASDAGQRLMARVPQRSFGRPEDLDAALLLLVGQAGRYITGAMLPVDGGHLVSTL